MSRTVWADWIFRVVRNRRDKPHRGPRTLVVLHGSSAAGKSTVARCLARRYGLASVDTNLIKRAMGIIHDQLALARNAVFPGHGFAGEVA